MGVAHLLESVVPWRRTPGGCVGSPRPPIPSGRISQPVGGTLEVGGGRERTDRVRKFRDRRSLVQNASYSRNTSEFGVPDATYGQPLHVSSWPSRVDDAAASRRATSHGFPSVFGGSLTCHSDQALARQWADPNRARRVLASVFRLDDR